MDWTPVDEQEIRYRVAHLKELPPLSRVLQRVLETFVGEAAAPSEIERLVLFDQALSAKILRLANSTPYGFRGEVQTLSHAFDVLGLDLVKSVCCRALLGKLFYEEQAADTLAQERLWKHAYLTARVAAGIATRRPWISREQAFILGLLHDLGLLVLAVSFREHYSFLLGLAENRRVPPWYLEAQFGLSHTLVGKWVSIRWAFPEVFQRVMEFHHTPDRSPSFKAEVNIIHLADALAHSLDYPGLGQDELTLACCRELCITAEEWGEHRERLNGIRLETEQFWNVLK